MKTIFTTIFSLLILLSTVNAGDVYKITKSETWFNNGDKSYPNPCYQCTFNIDKGVVLTIEKDVTFQDVVFNGGTVIMKGRDMMLWKKDGKNYFNNMKVIFQNSGMLTGNGPMVLTNSEFTFTGKSNMLSNHSLEMISSNLKFTEDAFFVGQGTTVSLLNSHMVAGDGSVSSNAYIKMNGAQLILEDKSSGLDVMNNNNYYFNWKPYTSVAAAVSFETKENKKNCGGANLHGCEAPVLYGPIALTPKGLAAPLILPVVIADYGVVSANNAVNVSWSTQQEMNSSYFSVERSADGKNWKEIGQVKAMGTSSVITKYNFKDIAPVNGAAHYRLKMIDLDAAFAYSDVKSIRTDLNATVKVYPNPASDFANITLAPASGNTTIRLLNMNGQVMIEKNVPVNSRLVSLPLQQYSNGSYVISISGDNGTLQTIKLMVSHK
jgi:hypothetical protein